MRNLSIVGMAFTALSVLAAGTGCAGYTINPGHRALLFDPGNNGIQPEVIKPGWVNTDCSLFTHPFTPSDKCPRVDDFDVTYQTSNEQFHVISKEGLPMDVQIAVTYRPIVAELYLLDTEIGKRYFEKVIGPEFRNAAIGVFSKEKYQDLQRQNGDIEAKIQKRLQGRLKGKHLEVSSVFIQHVSYDNAILEQQQREVVSRQELQTSKQLRANKYEEEKQRLQLQTETKELQIEAQKKLVADETEKKKLELHALAEQKKLQMATDLRGGEARRAEERRIGEGPHRVRAAQQEGAEAARARAGADRQDEGRGGGRDPGGVGQGRVHRAPRARQGDVGGERRGGGERDADAGRDARLRRARQAGRHEDYDHDGRLVEAAELAVPARPRIPDRVHPAVPPAPDVRRRRDRRRRGNAPAGDDPEPRRRQPVLSGIGRRNRRGA